MADFLSQSDDETYDLILQLANIKNKYNVNTFNGYDIMDLLRIDKKACKRAHELANLKYTNTSGKNYIDYFSQTGGSGSTGLSELIAETNMLLNTYGYQYEIIKDRAQFLVQNFPKTIAYIATKFNLNMV